MEESFTYFPYKKNLDKNKGGNKTRSSKMSGRFLEILDRLVVRANLPPKNYVKMPHFAIPLFQISVGGRSHTMGTPQPHTITQRVTMIRNRMTHT
jgi:hypothetical protein